jgi:uncharacterized protein with PIN domain
MPRNAQKLKFYPCNDCKEVAVEEVGRKQVHPEVVAVYIKYTTECKKCGKNTFIDVEPID